MNATRSQGFTLVELAISLVVIGLLIALGMSMIGPLTVAIKVRQSRDNLGAAVEAINSWASGNNRLPDNAGGTTDVKNVVRTPTDAWNHTFIYLYDTNLYSASPTKDTICGRRSTSITLTDLNTGASIPNVAYLILSQGDDAVTDTTSGGVAVTTTAISSATTVAANTTSDLVRWVTLDELRSKVGCQGAQLKVANNELPYAYNQTTYTATIYADGGVPFSSGGRYRWCLQNSAGAVPANMTFKNTAGTSNIPFNTDCASLLESSWIQSDSILISGLPTVNVTGTDGKIYTAIQSHTAAAANQPITGANYATYWQLASGGAVGSTWAAGMYYTTMSQSLSVFVRDNNDSSGTNDSIAYKQLVLTINAQ